jgi:lipopolysaccharide export LptBFGC system permease protein LptF
MKIKPTYLGIFLIILFLVSSFAFTSFQTFHPSVQIPNQNILEQELKPEQKSYLLENGYTLIEIKYNINCENCLNQKNFLEQIASSQGFKEQIYLQAIQTDTKIPKIKIESIYGTKILENETQEKIIDAICELLVNKPLTCTLRSIK